MKVLRKAKENKENCEFFIKNLNDILTCSGIESINGITWIIDINQNIQKSFNNL